MNEIVFTPIQLIALLGMAQALYALVYMALRAGRLSRAGLALAYFFTLFCGFFYDFSSPFFVDVITIEFQNISWLCWFLLPSLSYLFVLQMAKMQETPHLYHYIVLLLPFLCVLAGLIVPEYLLLFGLLSGGVSLLAVWSKKETLQNIWKDGRVGQSRYWLVICLLVMNVMLLATICFYIWGQLGWLELQLLRNVLGVSFVYFVSTSLFRIYPQAVLVKEKRRLDFDNKENRRIIDTLSKLLTVERVYQEPQYGRKDLAQELGVSEATVSKVINDQYQKTVPQLLNSYRIEEAKGLLKDTNASVQVIAQEVGFHSLTTFNRVFKEVVQKTPSQFKRQK